MDWAMEKTLKHYQIYCWINTAWYGFLCFLGFAGLALARTADPDVLPSESQGVFQFACFALVVMGVGFGLANLSLMRQPKTPKAHLAHFINNLSAGSLLRLAGDSMAEARSESPF